MAVPGQRRTKNPSCEISSSGSSWPASHKSSTRVRSSESPRLGFGIGDEQRERVKSTGAWRWTRRGHEVEIVEAWRADGKESEDPLDYTLFHYSFESAHDVFSWCSIFLIELDSDFFTQCLLFLQLPRGRERDMQKGMVSLR